MISALVSQVWEVYLGIFKVSNLLSNSYSRVRKFGEKCFIVSDVLIIKKK